MSAAGAARSLAARRWLVFAALALLAACAAPTNPGGGSTTGLSLTYPAADARLAGTVALAASGIGGTASGLRFELGSASVDAAADGTAVLDTRSIPDGSYTLRATATVAGAEVMDEIPVRVDNDLPASGVVGAAGGSLKTPAGALVTVPPGGLPADASLTVEDVTQEDILADFNIDYPALGVTFLGALEVDTGGADVNLPLSLDLPGWAQAAQPGHQAVMFALAPDADGDGMGELMLAAEAQATAGGSVISRPTPRSEVYGFGAAGGLSTQQASSVRPGTILTMTGRGFNAVSPLSNVARYGGGAVPVAETLVDVELVENAAFNPLLEVRFAVPALGSGNQTVTLHNLTTGFRTDATSVGVLALGSGTDATWTGFREQVALAAGPLTADRADLAAAADAWLDALAAADPATFAAMATHSGLVSSGNRAALQQIAPGSLTAPQADLVVRHALVLDAMAASTSGAAASAAADLAALLMVTSRAAASPGTGGVGASQSTAPTCTGGATTPAAGITWGAPVTTGAGSAPPGSCGSGGASGGGVGPSAAELSPAALATTSVRAGSFRPVAGALVRVFRQGSEQSLTPFTAITDASGFFHIPFLAPGEPYTVRAIDLATLQVAEASGVAGGSNVTTPMQLVFGVAPQGPGDPVADFVIRPVADPRFEGTVYYEFDASGSSDDGTITEYVWSFGDFTRTVDWTPVVERGYGRNGTYEVQLTVIDDEGQLGTTTRQLVVSDLPYDYWGPLPERVTVGPSGEVPDREADGGAVVSADGRYVAFSTGAGNLDPGDLNTESDVYLKDMETGALELVSSGAPGVRSGIWIGMSADARYVAYGVANRSGSTYVSERIEVVDRQTGTVETVLPEGGLDRAYLEALSADGRKVMFESSVMNGARRVDVKDLDTQTVTRVGLELDGVTYAPFIEGIALSADGDAALFTALSGNLVAGDTNGRRDLFLHRRSDQTTVRVSVAQDGTEGDWGSTAVAGGLSPDGRTVAFWSESTTFPRAQENDQGTIRNDDLYLKDLVTGELTLISTNAADVSADGYHGTLSADGRYLAFGSYAFNLAPEMERYEGSCALGLCVLGFSYVKDLTTGRVVMITVGLDDTLPDDWDQSTPTISADGRYVIFESWGSNLFEGDVPDTRDWFRVENPLWQP